MLIVRFHTSFRERASEWVLAAIQAYWGITVLQADGLFDRSFYAPFARTGTQAGWGWAMLLLGFTRLAILFVNGTFRYSAQARQIGAATGMWLWVMLMMGALTLGWQTPAVAYFLGLFALDAISLSYASRDATITRERRNAALGS